MITKNETQPIETCKPTSITAILDYILIHSFGQASFPQSMVAGSQAEKCEV